ncbi:MAG: hypothetical protein LBC73_08115 [Oscillospiraceae bacterium]|jgi:hypothetical protein|nr:hypothetical protein [Oscillospiraceae bacterium]
MIILLVFLIGSLFIIACSSNVLPNDDGKTTSPNIDDNSSLDEIFDMTEVYFDFGDKQLYAIAILDDSIIFEGNNNAPDAERNNRIYYRYYFSTSSFVHIGTFHNFYMSTGDFTFIDNLIYFDSTLYTDMGAIYNAIFMIDLEQNSLTSLIEDMHSEPIFHIMPYKDGLLSLKRRLEDGYEISYFETFCLDTKKTEIILETKVNIESYEGSEYLSYTIRDDMIYVIYYDSQSDDNIVIRVYDENLKVVRTITFGETEQRILQNRPHTFRLFGDFAYIYNYSTWGYIVRIEDDDYLSYIHSGKMLRITTSANIKDDKLLLWEGFSVNVFLFDIKTGTVEKVLMDFDDGYNIMYITANETLMYICIFPEEISYSNYRYFLHSVDNLH